MIKHHEKIRRENQIALGFGIDAMKTKKVCTHCGAITDASQQFCCECKSPLPCETVFEAYAKRHRRCNSCGTVAAKDMNYCPLCGKTLPK